MVSSKTKQNRFPVIVTRSKALLELWLITGLPTFIFRGRWRHLCRRWIRFAAEWENFIARGPLRRKIVIAADGTLLDGYTAYLVAKMFGHDSLRVLMRI